MYVHVHKVFVKDRRCSNFTMSRAEYSLGRHKVFGRSKCLADKGRIPLGPPGAYCSAHIDQR